MNLRKALRPIVDAVIVPAVWMVRPLRSLFSHVGRSVGPDGYYRLKERFIANGGGSAWGRNVRADIVRRFETIDRRIPSQTSPTDGLFLAEALLSTDAVGAVVECGCYCGASAAKLSIVCKILGRQLHIFDSFEGLPTQTSNRSHDFSLRREAEGTDWYPGSFAASLEQVRANIQKWGEISACTFHQGWFQDTLTDENLPAEIAFAFTDVDLPNSARQCLVAIWPRLTERGVYFSHDAAFIKVLQTILDREIWQEKLKQFPPVFFGAGSGLTDASPCLGFAVKGPAVTAEYIKTLTINKQLTASSRQRYGS